MKPLTKILRRLLAYIILLIVMFAGTLLVYSFKTGSQNAPYTSYYTGYDGIKALYLLTEQMGYQTSRFEKPARFMPQDSVMIVYEPLPEIMNGETEQKYLNSWLHKGNTMILISSINFINDYYIISDKKPAPLEDSYKGYLIYPTGKGKVIFADYPEGFTNHSILSENKGVEFIKLLDTIGKNKVVFNEYYHGINDGSSLFINIIGQKGELLLLQLLLFFAALVLLKLKRFGKPVIVMENIKCQENENLMALGNIYARAKAKPLIIETLLEEFTSELGRYLGIGPKADLNEIIMAAADDRILKRYNLAGLINGFKASIAAGVIDDRSVLAMIHAMNGIRREIRV